MEPWTLINLLNANPTKWSNTLKQFVSKLPTNCLSVSRFVGLALKGLKNVINGRGLTRITALITHLTSTHSLMSFLLGTITTRFLYGLSVFVWQNYTNIFSLSLWSLEHITSRLSGANWQKMLLNVFYTFLAFFCCFSS